MKHLFLPIALLASFAVAFGNEMLDAVEADLDSMSDDIETMAVDIDKQKFLLYTRENKETAVELKNGNQLGLLASPFKAKRQTKFIIHGWQNNVESESMQILKNAYLEADDYNIIICDYEKYNSPYLSAVSNAKKIGTNIATFIKFLVKHGLKGEEIHILGHSLGAHIAGHAANDLEFQIARITGLDPAGPLFNNKAPKNRLSPDDALVVDVVHSSKEFGYTEDCGSIDYYPHGGTHQPVCDHADLSSGCDHSASYRYWQQSILVHSTYKTYECKTAADAQDVEKAVSKCQLSSAVMGDDALLTTSPGIYFVDV